MMRSGLIVRCRLRKENRARDENSAEGQLNPSSSLNPCTIKVTSTEHSSRAAADGAHVRPIIRLRG